MPPNHHVFLWSLPESSSPRPVPAPQCIISLRTAVSICFWIPFLGVLGSVLAAATARSDLDPATISDMIASDGAWLKVLFGTAMGSAAVLLPLGTVLLRVRMLKTYERYGLCKNACNELIFILCLGVVAGCVGLAVNAVDDNYSAHYAYAGIALGSQYALTACLVWLSYYDRESELVDWYHQNANRYVQQAALCLAFATFGGGIFALAVNQYAYVAEYVLVLAVFAAVTRLNAVPWNERVCFVQSTPIQPGVQLQLSSV